MAAFRVRASLCILLFVLTIGLYAAPATHNHRGMHARLIRHVHLRSDEGALISSALSRPEELRLDDLNTRDAESMTSDDQDELTRLVLRRETHRSGLIDHTA